MRSDDVCECVGSPDGLRLRIAGNVIRAPSAGSSVRFRPKRGHPVSRYHVIIANGLVSHHDEGVDLPDIAALTLMMRQTLGAMLRDEGVRGTDGTMTAYASDADARMILTMTVRLFIN